MKKMICDFCLENIEFENHKYACPICEREWNEIILTDKNFYDSDCVTHINPIIALEYKNLITLIENKQIYGIILQIKDIYEIIIRIPVLIMSAFALHNRQAVKGKDLLFFMMSKPLSLGDWRYLLTVASETAKELEDIIPNEVVELINIIRRFANSNKSGDIVYWRNSTISHGATKQLNNEELYDDTSTKLREITTFLKKNAQTFKDIVFIDENNVELDGLNYDFQRDGKIFLKIKNKAYPLYPFFTIRDEGVYLFDRYVHKFKKTDIIDYVKSVKTTVEFEELNNLYIESSISQFDNRENIETYTIEERNLCEEIASGSEFLKPDFLIDTISKELLKSKSVFAIQMEKGMGKSYFVRALDPFSLNNIDTDYTAVKAFYINSTYNSRINDFCISVEDMMRKKTSGYTIANSMIRLNVNEPNSKKAFANFLNEYKQKYYYDRNILFIFDGVDELRIQKGKNITDFIPDVDDLIAGVFVMITLRTNKANDKVSPFIRNFINEFKGVKYVYTKDNDEYLSFAKRYFDLFFTKKIMLFCKRNKIQNNINIHNMNKKFMEIEDKSMLNLNLIRELTLLNLSERMKTNNYFFDVDKLSFGSEMYKAYFNSIKEYYGSKYYEKFINVLCCLALSDRALSLEELSILSGNNNLNFAFLGFINSMKMFLDTVRDDRGTLFTISHADKREIIITTFTTEIESLKKQIIERIKTVTNTSFSYETPEDYIYYSCVNSIVNDFKNVEPDRSVAQELFVSMLSLPLNLSWAQSRKQTISQLKVFNNVMLFEKFDFDLSTDEKLAYFKILTHVAFNEMLLKNVFLSEHHFRKAIDFYKRAQFEPTNFIQKEYAETLSLYATLLWDTGNDEEAFKLYEEVVDIKKALNKVDKNIVSDIDLLSEYVCLSNIANTAALYNEQIEILNKVNDEIKECQSSEKKQRTIPFMNASYFNYYSSINDPEKAIIHVKKAINQYEECSRNPKSLMYIPDLVKYIYQYINYLWRNNISVDNFEDELQYFESVIAYLQQYRNYDDPYSYMRYLLSLYKYYINVNNIEKNEYYKSKLFDYYYHLDDKFKEDERLFKIIEIIKKEEQ